MGSIGGVSRGRVLLKIQSPLWNKFLLTLWISSSKIRSLYISELIFTPWGTKIRLVRQLADTPAQTIQCCAFRSHQYTCYHLWCLLMMERVYDNSANYEILQGWKLFQLKKKTHCEPGQKLFGSCKYLCLKVGVRWCTVWSFNDLSPNSFRTTFLTDSWSFVTNELMAWVFIIALPFASAFSWWVYSVCKDINNISRPWFNTLLHEINAPWN